MLYSLYTFLVLENFGALVTFFVGLFVFIIYFLDRTQKEKSAASIILEEIRSAERNILKLKESGNFLNVVPQSFTDSGWEQYGHLIVKYFDFDELNEISNFFEKVRALKQALSQWQNIHLDSMKTKATYMQSTLIDMAVKFDGNHEEYVAKKDKLTRLVHPESYWFEPDYFKNRVGELLGIATISTSATGSKLKNLTKKGSFSH